MSTFQNRQKISNITMKPIVRCFCPLGQAWYTGHFAVHFVPSETIPDYCDIDKWVKDNIDGQCLIIEDAVAAIYEHLQTTYTPAGLHIIADVEDAGHFAVEVERR